MRDFALILGFFAFWIVLNRWILPWFGVPTCMSGGCAASCRADSAALRDSRSDKDVVESKGD